MDLQQLYVWSKRVVVWASTNNLLSSPIIAPATVAYYPTPCPVIETSVRRSTYQKYHVAVWLKPSAAASTRQEEVGVFYLGLPRTDSFNWYANPVNKSVTFSVMRNMGTLVNGAVFGVWLHSSGDNIITVRHSGNATRVLGVAGYGGVVVYSSTMQFSVTA
jgi:hypothetical protein